MRNFAREARTVTVSTKLLCYEPKSAIGGIRPRGCTQEAQASTGEGSADPAWLVGAPARCGKVKQTIKTLKAARSLRLAEGDPEEAITQVSSLVEESAALLKSDL